MKETYVFGYYAPALKGETVEDDAFKSKEIKSNSSLYPHLIEILNKAEKECDIPVSFIPEKGVQKNLMRTMILDVLKKKTIESGLPIVRRLCLFTDHKTKDGLLFIMIEKEDNNYRFCMARFPSEIGIMIKSAGEKIDFEVKNDVFLKNSKRYKSIVFSGANTTTDFWDGSAIDRQIGDSERMKEISDYWIKDFMMCTLKITAKRGSKILAKALQKAISSTDNDEIKREIINASSLVKNQKGKPISVVQFFEKFGISQEARNIVLGQFEESEQEITRAKFTLDVEEFFKFFNYRFVFMDNGAIAVASSEKFNDVWDVEAVAEGPVTYSTRGIVINEKIASRL